MTVPVRRRLLVAVAVTVLAGACGGDDGGEEAVPDPSSTTEAPEFEGDPDSAFCVASREAADQPVLDPFAPGLDPREVRLRFEALSQRFQGFAGLAPEPLEEDLALLEERFDQLAAVLEEADYDFEQLIGAREELAPFDDPALADVAARLAAYQEQVCTP